jgi:hypothetical protein
MDLAAPHLLHLYRSASMDCISELQPTRAFDYKCKVVVFGVDIIRSDLKVFSLLFRSSGTGQIQEVEKSHLTKL